VTADSAIDIDDIKRKIDSILAPKPVNEEPAGTLPNTPHTSTNVDKNGAITEITITNPGLTEYIKTMPAHAFWWDPAVGNDETVGVTGRIIDRAPGFKVPELEQEALTTTDTLMEIQRQLVIENITRIELAQRRISADVRFSDFCISASPDRFVEVLKRRDRSDSPTLATPASWTPPVVGDRVPMAIAPNRLEFYRDAQAGFRLPNIPKRIDFIKDLCAQRAQIEVHDNPPHETHIQRNGRYRIIRDTLRAWCVKEGIVPGGLFDDH
jgi:hypothetical protein